MTNLRILPARPEDVPIILDLIRGLGEYERLSHEIVATEDGLRKWLFGERPVAEVALAYVDTVVVGFALFFHNFSTFWDAPACISRTCSSSRNGADAVSDNGC